MPVRGPAMSRAIGIIMRQEKASWSLMELILQPLSDAMFVGVHVLSPGTLKRQSLNSRLFALPHSNASSRRAGDFCLSLKAFLWYIEIQLTY